MARARVRLEELPIIGNLQAWRSPSPAIESEASLVSRAAKGDEDAFETIMRSHNQLLFRTARSILQNDSDAEDAVQDAFLRAWLARVKIPGSVRLAVDVDPYSFL